MAKLKIEIADNPVALAKGLMGREELPENEGMLFKFPMTVEARFWGKNTYIPLDIAFVDKNHVITDIKQITPLSTRTVVSNQPCLMAIEANGGFFSNNKIKAGHKIEIIQDAEGKEIEISFKSNV